MINFIGHAASSAAHTLYNSCAYVAQSLAALYERIKTVVSRIFNGEPEPQIPKENVFNRKFSPKAPEPAKKVDEARRPSLPAENVFNRKFSPKAPEPVKKVDEARRPSLPNEFEVKKVKGDGNCLYYSLMIHLDNNREKIEKANPEMKNVKTHQELRALAVAGMKNYQNDDALAGYLALAVENHNENQQAWRDQKVASLKISLDKGQLERKEYDRFMKEANEELVNGKINDVEDYIRHAAEDCFFAGDAELYVLANRMRIQVVIQGMEYQPIGQDRAGCGPLKLKYGGAHYDPIVPKLRSQ